MEDKIVVKSGHFLFRETQYRQWNKKLTTFETLNFALEFVFNYLPISCVSLPA